MKTRRKKILKQKPEISHLWWFQRLPEELGGSLRRGSVKGGEAEGRTEKGSHGRGKPALIDLRVLRISTPELREEGRRTKRGTDRGGNGGNKSRKRHTVLKDLIVLPDYVRIFFLCDPISAVPVVLCINPIRWRNRTQLDAYMDG